jgi:hypothetical protein
VVIDPPRIPAKVAGGFQRSEQSPSPGLRRSRRRASSRHHCEMQMHLWSYWPRHRVTIEASPTAALPEVTLVLTHANVGLHPGCHTRGSWAARRPYLTRFSRSCFKVAEREGLPRPPEMTTKSKSYDPPERVMCTNLVSRSRPISLPTARKLARKSPVNW